MNSALSGRTKRFLSVSVSAWLVLNADTQSQCVECSVCTCYAAKTKGGIAPTMMMNWRNVEKCNGYHDYKSAGEVTSASNGLCQLQTEEE